ncbi:PepSY domain-containing protein [Rhizobium sp.]
MKTMLISFAAIITLSAGVAKADDGIECRGIARETYLPASTIEEKAKGLGIDVRGVRVDNGCYEVRAEDMHGDDFDIYFHPVTAKVLGVDD